MLKKRIAILLAIVGLGLIALGRVVDALVREMEPDTPG